MDYYDDINNVKNYIEMAKDSDAWELIHKLRKHLKEGSKLLEIGMGPGNDLIKLEEYYKVLGSDKYSNFVEEYKKKYNRDNALVLDAISLDIDDEFDAIYSNKVLMHLTRRGLECSLERQAKILSDRGIVLHTFWLGDGEETYSGMLNVYYGEEELRRIFSRNFTIIELEKYMEFENDDSIIVIARKKQL